MLAGNNLKSFPDARSKQTVTLSKEFFEKVGENFEFSKLSGVKFSQET